MSRSSQADAARHREKVVDATSRMLRERGAANVSVQEAMSAAGLTHGGFYKHFRSKDDLVAAATRDAFGDILGRLDRVAAESPDGPTARDRLVTEYLSPEHRDAPGTGCANAALATDAARATSPELRAAFTDGLRATVDRLAAVEGGGPDARAHALVDLVVLVGSLTLARATTGDPVSDELLALAREHLAQR